MAILRGQRLPIEFSTAFPQKLLAMGEVCAAIKYNPDRNASPEQEIDYDSKTGTGTMKPLWKLTVTDPHEGSEGKAKLASFEITFIADVQPVFSTQEIAPGTGMRWVELEGVTAEPVVVRQGQGEKNFSYVSYRYRATGIKGDNSGAKVPPADPGASRPAKAA